MTHPHAPWVCVPVQHTHFTSPTHPIPKSIFFSALPTDESECTVGSHGNVVPYEWKCRSLSLSYVREGDCTESEGHTVKQGALRSLDAIKLRVLSGLERSLTAEKPMAILASVKGETSKGPVSLVRLVVGMGVSRVLV